MGLSALPRGSRKLKLTITDFKIKIIPFVTQICGHTVSEDMHHIFRAFQNIHISFSEAEKHVKKHKRKRLTALSKKKQKQNSKH